MTDLLTSGEQGLRKWNQRADLGGYGGGGGQVRTSRPAWQGRSLAEGRAGVDTVSKGSTQGSGTAGVRAVGTDCLCHPRLAEKGKAGGCRGAGLRV